jgi:hypothetical protein
MNRHKVLLFVICLVMAPTVAYAHGDQILLLLVPDALWIVFVVAALFLWNETKQAKGVIATAVIGGVIGGYFLPFNYFDYLEHMARYIITRAVVPLSAGLLVYFAIIFIRKYKQKGAL